MPKVKVQVVTVVCTRLVLLKWIMNKVIVMKRMEMEGFKV